MNFQLVNLDAVETLGSFGSQLEFYIGGRTALTQINERVLSVSNIRVDFRNVGIVQMSDLTIQVSNKTGDFDTFYTDIREAQFFIDVDGQEWFRGVSDKTNFEFDRNNEQVTIRLLTGQINDRDLDFNIVTSFPNPTIGEWLEDVFDQVFGITTVNYDLGFAYQVNGKDTYIVDGDAGVNDQVVLMEDIDSGILTANRFPQIMAMLGLEYVIWKGEAYVYYKDQFFSNTIVLSESDNDVTNVKEYKDYEQDDFFNQVILQARRFDAGFGFKIDKFWSQTDDALEVLDYDSDNMLPHWETGLGNWTGGGASTTFTEVILSQGGDDYFWAKLENLRGETSFVDDMQFEIATDLVLQEGDTICGSFAYYNLTGATRIQVRVGDNGTWKDIELERFDIINPQSEPTSTQAFPLAEFEYTVDDVTGGSNIFFRFVQNEFFGDEFAIPIVRGFDAGGDYEIILARPHNLIGANSNDLNLSVFQTNSVIDVGQTPLQGVVNDTTIEIIDFPGDPAIDQGYVTFHEGGIIINDIRENGPPGEVRVTTNDHHKLEVGDIVLITGQPVAAYNGFKTVTIINNNRRYRFNDGITGRPNSSTGLSVKAANIRRFYYSDMLIFRKVSQPPITEIQDYSEPFVNQNNPRYEVYDKQTAAFIGSPFNENILFKFMKKAAAIYIARNGTQFKRRFLVEVARTDINPYSRIELDGVNCLIEQFGFDLDRGETTLELIEV